ncbi:YraN family protein [Cryobacterium sp. AP23]
MAHKDDVGRRGEDCAAEYLLEAGYTLLERNWRCDQGEIDLIATRNGDIVFVEVKTRSGTGFGHPFEAITVAKLARLRRLAGAWCRQSGLRARRIRIDAIAVITRPGQEPQVEHLEGVF